MLRGVEELADAVKVTMGPKVWKFSILTDFSCFFNRSRTHVDVVLKNWGISFPCLYLVSVGVIRFVIVSFIVDAPRLM